MIKRMYFMSGKKYHGDGAGSFGYNSSLVTYTSWLPNHVAAFVLATEICESRITGKGNMQILTFNRV
jgi:hypothetical protein